MAENKTCTVCGCTSLISNLQNIMCSDCCDYFNICQGCFFKTGEFNDRSFYITCKSCKRNELLEAFLKENT